jgi:hypothetical protein
MAYRRGARHQPAVSACIAAIRASACTLGLAVAGPPERWAPSAAERAPAVGDHCCLPRVRPGLRHTVIVSAILTTLIGGLLAISGGLVGIALTDRRERTRWMRDSQLQASISLLSALQLLVRRMINVAYLDPQVWADQESLDPGRRRDKDPQSSATVAAFVEATVAWNNALYRALLIAPPSVATKIPDLDREVDRLVDLAVARSWTRTEFRQERAGLGRMAAEYLRLARSLAGLPDIELPSIWTWDSGSLTAAESGQATNDPG